MIIITHQLIHRFPDNLFIPFFRDIFIFFQESKDVATSALNNLWIQGERVAELLSHFMSGSAIK